MNIFLTHFISDKDCFIRNSIGYFTDEIIIIILIKNMALIKSALKVRQVS